MRPPGFAETHVFDHPLTPSSPPSQTPFSGTRPGPPPPVLCAKVVEGAEGGDRGGSALRWTEGRGEFAGASTTSTAAPAPPLAELRGVVVEGV
jgi:hypothetical protein